MIIVRFTLTFLSVIICFSSLPGQQFKTGSQLDLKRILYSENRSNIDVKTASSSCMLNQDNHAILNTQIQKSAWNYSEIYQPSGRPSSILRSTLVGTGVGFISGLLLSKVAGYKGEEVWWILGGTATGAITGALIGLSIDSFRNPENN